MQQNYILVLAALACAINAIPLNINLGAYSPALVVGDGEISFGGKQDVSNLMSALQGAAGGAAAAAPATAAVVQPAAVQPATEAAVIQAAPVDETTQITALQGMGKEIAPRVVPLRRGKKSKKSIQRARDLATFNAALKYATDALVNGPEIQMGTEAAGVGILQKAGKQSAQAKAAIIAAREEILPVPKTRTTVTTMFIKGGLVPAGAEAAASVAATPAKAARSVEEKREPGAIDGVNLNMAAGQVAELTFVETRSVDEDEEEEEDEE